VSRAAALALLTLLAGALPASAQLQWTIHGHGETDQNDVEFGLVGVSFEPRRLGWLPTARFDISRLQYSIREDSVNVWTGIAALGLRYAFNGGSIAVRAGYVVTEDVSTVQPSVPADFGGGVVNAVEFEYRGARAIGSYNYGAENGWARASAAHRIAQLGEGYFIAGGEAGYVNGPGVRSIQPGIVLGWHRADRFDLLLGAGRRFGSHRPIVDDDDTIYFRIELRYSPER
jgi:hypothetical protein